MKTELEDKLFEKYPKIFKDVSIECGDGWYNIIDTLCHQLQGTIDVSKGHYPQIVATQVKQKFGHLRFYYSPYVPYLDGMITMMSNMSGTVCENCGASEKVKMTKEGWITPLCQKCHRSEKANV